MEVREEKRCDDSFSHLSLSSFHWLELSSIFNCDSIHPSESIPSLSLLLPYLSSSFNQHLFLFNPSITFSIHSNNLLFFTLLSYHSLSSIYHSTIPPPPLPSHSASPPSPPSLLSLSAPSGPITQCLLLHFLSNP